MAHSVTKLPAELLNRAVYGMPGREFAWRLDDIPEVIEAARRASLVSLNGTLQFRLPGEVICECYWVNVDPGNAPDGLDWQSKVNWAADFCRRRFDEITLPADLVRAGRDEFGGPLKQLSYSGTDIVTFACFVWSVCDQQEYEGLQREMQSLRK
jgi:hypothetical protein